MSVIPEKSLFHSVALFSRRKNCSDEFLKALERRCPGIIVNDAEWTSVSSPRPVAYGPIQWNGWRWQVIMDLEGLVAEMRSLLADCARNNAVKERVLANQMCALVYLVETPASATPIECLQANCRLTWAYMDGGACLVSFPEGRTIWTREHLRTLEPEQLDADCVHAFVSSDCCGEAEGGGYWLRTWGMHHFGLADIACVVSADEERRHEVAAAEELMRLAPPYLASLGRNIQHGETLDVYDTRWRVSAATPADPALVSPGGMNLYSLEQAAAVV